MILTNEKLYNKRVEKGWTRPQLAEEAEVSWETIKAYEVKGATPSLQVALKISKALDSTVEELFGNLVEKPDAEMNTALEFFSELQNAEESI